MHGFYGVLTATYSIVSFFFNGSSRVEEQFPEILDGLPWGAHDAQFDASP